LDLLFFVLLLTFWLPQVDDLHKKSCEFLQTNYTPLLATSGSGDTGPGRSETGGINGSGGGSGGGSGSSGGGGGGGGSSSSGGGGGGARFIDTVRKALSSARARNQEQQNANTGTTGRKSLQDLSGTLRQSSASKTLHASSKSDKASDKSLPSLTVHTQIVSPSTSPSLDTPPPRVARMAVPDSDDSSLNSIELEHIQQNASQAWVRLVGAGAGRGR